MEKILLLVCVLVIASGGVFALFRYKNATDVPSVAHSPIVEDCSVTDVGVIDAVNQYRSEVSVPKVVFNQKLDNFADQRALEENGTMDSHVGLVGAADQLGYPLVGEIQNGPWTGCVNSNRVVSNFRYSEKHWKALLNPAYKSAGVGFYSNVLVIDFITE